MFGMRKDRRNTHGSQRARALVEELEPRTLLATSPLASVLAPLSSPLALLGTAPALSPSAAPAPGGVTPALASVPSTMTPPTPVSAVTPLGPTAGSQPPAPVTGGLATSGNLTTLPGTAGSTPTAALPVSPVAQPDQASFSTITAPTPANVGTPGIGAALTPTNGFTGLPSGPNAVAPGAAPGALGVGTESPTAVAVLTFLGLPGPVGVSFAQPFLALTPLGPGPTITTPNAATDAPLFFNSATHRLFSVVGGPEDRGAEDSLNEYDDGTVLPAPNAPLPRGMEDVRPQAPELLPEARPEDDTWAWDEYFAEEFLAVARGVDGLPSLGAAEGAGVGATAQEAPPNPATFPELLSAVAGIGLWNGMRRQHEDDREQPPRRRRPTVVPIGSR